MPAPMPPMMAITPPSSGVTTGGATTGGLKGTSMTGSGAGRGTGAGAGAGTGTGTGAGLGPFGRSARCTSVFVPSGYQISTVGPPNLLVGRYPIFVPSSSTRHWPGYVDGGPGKEFCVSWPYKPAIASGVGSVLTLGCRPGGRGSTMRCTSSPFLTPNASAGLSALSGGRSGREARSTSCTAGRGVQCGGAMAASAAAPARRLVPSFASSDTRAPARIEMYC